MSNLLVALDGLYNHWPQTPKYVLNDYRPLEIPGVGRDDIPGLLEAFFPPEQKVIWGAEIGVERGIYTRVLLRAPRVRLFMVDPWEAYPGYRDHVTQEKLEGFMRTARDVTQEFHPGRASIIRRYSVDAAKLQHDGSLDFVYIDGNHTLPHVIADLAAWIPKVRSRG